MRFSPLVTALALAAGTSAAAQTPSDSLAADSLKVYTTPSITVTTIKAAKNDSPVPFSEISRAEIRQTYGYEDMPALLGTLPSMLFYSENGNAVGYSNLSMRGFDQRRIAVTVNGIPQNDPEDHNVYWIDLPDLASSTETIQVQRGAGLVNYGAAAIGGSINIATANFANERFIRVLSGIGYQQYSSDNSFVPSVSRYSVEVSSGVVDRYAFYGRLSRIHSDGYRDNSWATLNSYFLSGVRYDDRVTTQINIFGGPLSDGLAYTGVPKAYVSDPVLRRANYSDWGYRAGTDTVEYTVLRRDQELEEFSQPHYELLNDWYVSDSVTIKSALFYYTGEGFFDFDGSWASFYDPAELFRMTPAYGFEPGAAPANAIIRAFVSNRHGGWLPRAIWRHGAGTLTAGLEARLHRSEHWGSLAYAENLPAGYDPDYRFYRYDGERDIFSAFAREQYQATSNLMLQAEAQVVHHAYRITDEYAGPVATQYATTDGTTAGNGGELFTVNYLFVNPRLGALLRIDDRTTVFGNIAYTSREPRMANLYNASESYLGALPQFEADTTGGITRYDFSQPLVRPERMLDIEFGGDYRSDAHGVALTLYWMEFTDELVKNGRLDIFGNPIDGNAPRTRHIGVELEGFLTLLNGSAGQLALYGNATVSSNRIIDYRYVADSDSTVDLAGNPIAGFPDVMGAVRLGYRYGDLAATLTGRFVGPFYTDNFHSDERKNDAYSVYDADISYTLRDIAGLRGLRLFAQINNLLNTLYSAGGVGVNFFPAAERLVFMGVEATL